MIVPSLLLLTGWTQSWIMTGKRERTKKSDSQKQAHLDIYLPLTSESQIKQKTLYHFFCRILVLDKGRIAEFDSPTSLLNRKSSIFHSLAKEAGLIWLNIVVLLWSLLWHHPFHLPFFLLWNCARKPRTTDFDLRMCFLYFYLWKLHLFHVVTNKKEMFCFSKNKESWLPVVWHDCFGSALACPCCSAESRTSKRRHQCGSKERHQ